MKRFINYFLFVLIILITFPSIVGAASRTKPSTTYDVYSESTGSGKKTLLCSYITSRKDGDVKYYNIIDIYYNNEGKDWLLYWDSIVETSNRELGTKKFGASSKVFSTSGKNVFISSSAVDNLTKSGKCPSKAWYDYDGLNGGNEICFGEASYCQKKNNVGTKFASKGTSSSKVYDVKTQLQAYVDRGWAPAIKDCKTLASKNFNIDSQITKDFENFKKGFEAPDWLKNSFEKDVKNKLKKSYEDLKNKCIKEAEENNVLTPEARQELIDSYNEGYEEADKQLKKAQKAIEDLPTAYDINNYNNTYIGENACNDSNIKKALRFAGYVLLLAKLFIPLLVIGFGIFDLYKAVINTDEFSKQVKMLGYRVGIGLFVFFAPTLLNAVFTQIEGYSDAMDEYKVCRTCVLDPTECDISD